MATATETTAAGAAAGAPPLLEMRGITKYFGGLTAVADVDLELWPGEVLAIVGDNGAGKSTLIKILTGVYAADGGEMFMEGRPLVVNDRRDSMEAGIDAVYQNLALVDTLDAPQNVFLGNEIRRYVLGIPFLRNRFMQEEARRTLRENVGVEIENIDEPTHNLSGGQRQAVAIARAIYHTDLKVLVMDEPTAALGPEETRNTLRLIRRLREGGLSIIVISHNLEHVFAVADRIMVMRYGRHVGTLSTKEATKRDVLSLIVGAEREEVAALD
jgi:ABC-type sugar transport system ATPase subunit